MMQAATASRRTTETDVTVRMKMDGGGRSDIHTGVGFLDHMLQQISTHGRIDLNISAKGDLQNGVHHTAEDIGIVMGSAFRKAIGEKASEGSAEVSMDDVLGTVAIDTGMGPHLVYDVPLRSESLGSMETEAFHEFFQGFAAHARINLHVRATGLNDHHKIESVFKATGRALRQVMNG